MNAQAKAPIPSLFDMEAEELILGTCLADQSAFWAAAERLRGQDFHEAHHERLWDAISEKRNANQQATAVTLKSFADNDPDISGMGGTDYLRGLAAQAVSARSLRPVLDAVQNLARKRAIIEAATALVDDVYYSDLPSSDLCDRACEELYEAAHSGERGDGPEPIEDVVLKAAQAAENAKNNPSRTFVTTGLKTLDEKLGGLFPRALTVLGAAPSMGKTSLAAQMAEGAARSGKIGAFFSKEMGSEEIATRYLGQAAGIPSDRLETGRISDKEMLQVAASPERFRGLPLWIDGASDLSVAQIRARSHGVKRRAGGLDFIMIDHLRFIEPANRRDDERDQLQQITRGLKRLAKEMNVAVLLIAHLNREFWRRNSKRPLLSDLYGASAIEQNADHIWFLHREEYYLERDKPDQGDDKAYGEWVSKLQTHIGKAEVFGAKRRGGPLGSATVEFDPKIVRFSDIEEAAPTESAGLLV